MASKEEIQTIIERVFALKDPPIDVSCREKVTTFVETIVNGDTTKDSLAINAVLGKDKSGVIIYIITNVRLIKIDINTASSEMKSSDFFLNRMSMEWKASLAETEIKISYLQHSFTLRYPAGQSGQQLTEFFKKVDEARVSAEAANGKK